MRKILLGLLLVSVIGGALYLHRRKRQPVETGYASSRAVIIWNTIAAVRQPVATVDYGTRLEVLRHFGDQVKVRAAGGAVGWTSASNLLTSDFWNQMKQLDSQTAAMPIEARGATAVLANLHISPGRGAPRIRQLGKLVPVDMFERKALDVPGAARPPGQAGEDADSSAPRKEDWWLVRAHLPDNVIASGWVLGRFIQLNLPEALYDYASSADMRAVAWFQLDTVPDGERAAKPQYLLVGTHGPEGQPCDFSMLRVYTWSKKRQQYETAYVESGLCGELPVRIEPLSAGEVNFSFRASTGGTVAQAVYRLHDTIVRRQKLSGSEAAAGKQTHG